MIEFGNKIYFIDIEKFDEMVQKKAENKEITTTSIKTYLDENGKIISTETHTQTFERDVDLNVTKNDILRTMMEVVLDLTSDDIDDTLGADRGLEKTSLSFKIAFNTLHEYGILVEKE